MDCSMPGLLVMGCQGPSPSPKVCPSSCLLHQWCHPAVSSSDTLYSFCPQSLPASEIFPVIWLFTSGDHNTGASASALPLSIQGWFPLRLTGLISLQSEGLSGVFSNTTVHQFLSTLPSLWSSSHNCPWPLGRPHSLDYMGLYLPPVIIFYCELVYVLNIWQLARHATLVIHSWAMSIVLYLLLTLCH